VSSAGEQLTSNKIYDGENTTEELLDKRGSFCCFQCHLWLKKLIFSVLLFFFNELKIYKNILLSTEPVMLSGLYCLV